MDHAPTEAREMSEPNYDDFDPIEVELTEDDVPWEYDTGEWHEDLLNLARDRLEAMAQVL